MARKKEAHHGGAWKVAYADFVTAMMALFMVLWICAQDKQIVIATSQYFQNPFKGTLNNNSGVMPFDSNRPNKPKENDRAKGNQADSGRQIELTFLNSLSRDFYRLLHLDENLEDKPIEIEVTSNGLSVTLFDRARQPLFRGNTAEFTERGLFIMQNLAWMIDRYQFRVSIDGHTRAGIKFPDPGYGAWDLSTDRANAARRVLTHYAVAPALIDRIAGNADQHPIPGLAPEAEPNQRVALSLAMSRHTIPYDKAGPGDPTAPAAAAAPGKPNAAPAAASSARLPQISRGSDSHSP